MEMQISDWNFPQQNKDAWFLGNTQAAWAVSKKTGQVLGGWNTHTKDQYLNWNAGRYYVQDAKSTFAAREEEDQVTNAQIDTGKQELHLTCVNPAIDGLKIEKLYSIQSGRLIKQTSFSSSKSGLLFITFNSEVSFLPSYRDKGYYMGAGFIGPLIPAPSLNKRQKVTQYRTSSKGMVLSQNEKGYSFAQYRYKMDGKFVWPWWTSDGELENMLSYTPTGWEMSLGTLSLANNHTASYEEHFSIFPGTWYDFLAKDYASLPEVQKERSRIPSPPDWLDEVKLNLWFYDLSNAGLENLRQAVRSYDAGDILVTINPVVDWANYDLTQPHHGLDGGAVTGPEIKKWIEQIRAISPRIKVGLYHWDNSAFADGDIYKKHPEWFRAYDKEGNAINLFPGVAANYASMIDNPALYRALQGQLEQEMNYLHPDFIYLDGANEASNLIDWKTGELTRDDQWQQFWLDVGLNARKQNPDALTFFNGWGNPYGAVNYIEARSQLRPGFWREFAGMALATEVFAGAKERIIPLYWTSDLAQSYINHVLALGWIPSPEKADILRYRPFITAAYEIGNTTPVDASYSPDWKRDSGTQLESYLVRRNKGQERLLSLINHEKETKLVNVTIQTDTLGLDKSKNLYIWGYRIADAANWSDALSEHDARQAYLSSGWMLDRVTTPELLYHGRYQPQIKLNIELNPLQLYMVSFNTQPAVIYSEDGLPTTFRFTTSRQVNISSESTGNTIQLIVNSECGNAKVLLTPPVNTSLKKVSIDGKSSVAQLSRVGDEFFPIVSVGKGRHEVKAEFVPSTNQPVKNSGINATATAGNLSITLPAPFHTARSALITVSQSGETLFNQLVSAEDGICRIPLTTQLSGAYQINVDAVEQEGQLVGLQNAPAKVALEENGKKPASVVPSPPMIPGKQDIHDINQTINGVRILRQATEITATPDDSIQAGMPGLTATADAAALALSAGTTEKTANFEGAAFSGFEMEGVKQVKLRLDNTFYNAFSLQGKQYHYPMYKVTQQFFAGIVLNYHTAKGYTKKVALGAGAMASNCNIGYPTYAGRRAPDQIIDLGDIIDQGPDAIFALDLTKYAPPDWDGKLWLSVGSDMVAAGRRLNVHLLAVNEKAGDQFLEGTDPQQLEKLYHEPRSLTIPREFEPPVIDGVPDEKIWKTAAPIKPFFSVEGKGLLSQSTEAVAYYDNKNLYIRILCQENQRPRPITGRNAIWNDDEVEIWMSPQRDGKSYKQLIINAAGDKLEMDQNGTANFGAKVAANIESGRWVVEAAIPFSGLGITTPQVGDEWGFNICRSRPGDGSSASLSTWAPLEHSFNEPQNLAVLKFGS